MHAKKSREKLLDDINKRIENLLNNLQENYIISEHDFNKILKYLVRLNVSSRDSIKVEHIGTQIRVLYDKALEVLVYMSNHKILETYYYVDHEDCESRGLHSTNDLMEIFKKIYDVEYPETIVYEDLKRLLNSKYENKVIICENCGNEFYADEEDIELEFKISQTTVEAIKIYLEKNNIDDLDNKGSNTGQGSSSWLQTIKNINNNNSFFLNSEELNLSESERIDLCKKIIDSRLSTNEILYNPTDEEYDELRRLYNEAFNQNNCAVTTTTKGSRLEDLIFYMFGICKTYFTTKTISNNTEQVDVVVRSIIPGMSLVTLILGDYIYIECKNEERGVDPKYHSRLVDIMNKHSIIRSGVLVTKSENTATNKDRFDREYLQTNKIILHLSMNDLKKICIEKCNLLILLELKVLSLTSRVDEIKMYELFNLI